MIRSVSFSRNWSLQWFSRTYFIDWTLIRTSIPRISESKDPETQWSDDPGDPRICFIYLRRIPDSKFRVPATALKSLFSVSMKRDGNIFELANHETRYEEVDPDRYIVIDEGSKDPRRWKLPLRVWVSFRACDCTCLRKITCIRVLSWSRWSWGREGPALLEY